MLSSNYPIFEIYTGNDIQFDMVYITIFYIIKSIVKDQSKHIAKVSLFAVFNH